MSNEDMKDMENRILEAAKTVFLRKGFVATKMSDIAVEAGTSRTSLHYYFRTKDMLFEAIFGQILNILGPVIETAMHQEGSLLDKLPVIIEQYNKVLTGNPQFPLFFINEIHRDPEHLYLTVCQIPGWANTLANMRSYIQDEMEKGILKKRPLIDILSTYLGLLIFPLLVQKPMTDVLLQGNTEEFEKFLERRKGIIVEVMTTLLKPDENK